MIPVFIALVAAVVVGVGASHQQVAARQEEPHAVMDPRLVLRLLRRRRWLIGVAITLGGFGLQAAAIATGRLVVVEPLLATQVLFALLASVRHSGLSLGRREWFGAAATVVGVGGFLVVAAPTASDSASQFVPWSVPLGGVAVVVIIGVMAASRMGASRRALTLALLAGLAFGCSDALIKLVSRIVGDLGVGALLGHWGLWAWLVISPVAFLLQQSAYHASHLAAALPGTSSLQPTTAALLGVAMFGEHVRGGGAVPVEVALVALALAGVVLLASSPLIEGERLSDVRRS
ncbi:MAG: DMT family transporter [Actinomycetota bacterium]